MRLSAHSPACKVVVYFEKSLQVLNPVLEEAAVGASELFDALFDWDKHTIP